MTGHNVEILYTFNEDGSGKPYAHTSGLKNHGLSEIIYFSPYRPRETKVIMERIINELTNLPDVNENDYLWVSIGNDNLVFQVLELSLGDSDFILLKPAGLGLKIIH